MQSSILATDAGLPAGCNQVYNANAIDAPAETDLCDAKDVSVKEFIETRRSTLYQELQEHGY